MRRRPSSNNTTSNRRRLVIGFWALAVLWAGPGAGAIAAPVETASLERVRGLIDQREYASADFFLRALLSEHGPDPQLRLLRAEVAVKRGQQLEGVRQLASLIRDSSSCDGYEALATLLYNQGALTPAYNVALAGITAGCAAPPLFIVAGECAHYNEQYSETLRHMQQALALDPANTHAQHGVIKALLETNQIAEAVEEASRILEAYPESATAWFLHGWVRGEHGEAAAGLPELRRATESPYAAFHWFNQCGLVLHQLEQYEGSLDMLRKALEKEPGSDQTWYLMAQCYQRLGRQADARDAMAIQQLLTASRGVDAAEVPASSLARGAIHLRQAREAMKRGEFERALGHARALGEVDPRNPWAPRLQASALVGLGRGAEARAILERAATVWGGNPEYYEELAKACEASGDPTAAAEWQAVAESIYSLP